MMRAFVLIICLATTASAAEVRLVEAVKKADKAAVRTLLQQRVDVKRLSLMARPPSTGRRVRMIWKPRIF